RAPAPAAVWPSSWASRNTCALRASTSPWGKRSRKRYKTQRAGRSPRSSQRAGNDSRVSRNQPAGGSCLRPAPERSTCSHRPAGGERRGGGGGGGAGHAGEGVQQARQVDLLDQQADAPGQVVLGQLAVQGQPVGVGVGQGGRDQPQGLAAAARRRERTGDLRES